MTPAELTARGVRVKYIYAPDCDECGDTGWVYFSCGTPWRCKCQRKSRAASPQERTMTDAMPRQDLKLPPPIGYISREEHAALIREAEARGMDRAAEICEGIRTRIANGPMPEGARFDYEQSIRAEAASIRAAKDTP